MSPEEWAFKISELIKEAEADGNIVSIDDSLNVYIYRDDRNPGWPAGRIYIDW